MKKCEKNSNYFFKLLLFWKYACDINYFSLGENYKSIHYKKKLYVSSEINNLYFTVWLYSRCMFNFSAILLLFCKKLTQQKIYFFIILFIIFFIIFFIRIFYVFSRLVLVFDNTYCKFLFIKKFSKNVFKIDSKM